MQHRKIANTLGYMDEVIIRALIAYRANLEMIKTEGIDITKSEKEIISQYIEICNEIEKVDYLLTNNHKVKKIFTSSFNLPIEFESSREKNYLDFFKTA